MLYFRVLPNLAVRLTYMVRPIRAKNLATTEGVVVAAVPCGVAATTTQIGKTYVSLEFYRRLRGSMIEGMRWIRHYWLMQLMQLMQQ